MLVRTVIASSRTIASRHATRALSSLSTGFVGLPNVGKSSLFNALVKGSTAEAANFPFCTIEPNTGHVAIGDRRLDELSRLSSSATTTHASLMFVDIAGLVEGASGGAGLGNKFLSDIREVDAIVHVVRCFDRTKKDIVHVLDGDIDPVRDATVINSELILSDLQQIERRLQKVARKPGGETDEVRALRAMQRGLEDGIPVRRLRGEDEAVDTVSRQLGLLSAKPMIYAANIDESDVGASTDDESEEVRALRAFASDEDGSLVVTVSAQLESELMELGDEERADYLSALDVEEDQTAIYVLTAATCELLGLMVFYTAGPQESRAWQCRQNTRAPQAAGVIHTDFEKKFIRAECVSFDNLVASGSMASAKERGLVRSEGKDYVVQDGDVLLFRHGA